MSSYGSFYLPYGETMATKVYSKRNIFKSLSIIFYYYGALFSFFTNNNGSSVYDDGSVFENWAAMIGGLVSIFSMNEIVFKNS